MYTRVWGGGSTLCYEVCDVNAKLCDGASYQRAMVYAM